ncbi:hypothetical protein JL720_10061 [Aureococcus anophagefferens]|nr:hypothetical protein JL720_10061 [Aureococcus anophagefferens]
MKFIGRNAELLLKNPAEPHCFRVHKDRIYYVSRRLMRMSTNFKRSDLLALGTCFARRGARGRRAAGGAPPPPARDGAPQAKITHSGKVHLQVTCLDHLAKHALHKVSKAGLGRITDAAPQYAGVVARPPAPRRAAAAAPTRRAQVLNLAETPLGFGVLAQPTEACKDLEPTANVVLHQADVGEYLRLEDTLF